ncbi:MAG: GNAT family N-acetyltransferase [Nitrospinota bacterium]
MPEVIIRTLRVGDVDEIMLLGERLTGERRPAHWREQLTAYWDGSATDPMGRDPRSCRVAEVDGKVVGFILGDVRGWEFGLAEAAWVWDLGVDPDYQGRGIGTMLAQSLFDYFRSKGARTVYTMVNWGDGRLLGYFKSLGFRRGDMINLEKTLE